MHTKNLLKLADLLEKDAKNKNGIQFDMGDWGSVDDKRKPISCGTTACAMGLAALSGAFKKQGLTAEIQGHGVAFKWKGSFTDAMDAAQHLFEIDYNTANRLFAEAAPGDDSGIGAKAEKAKAKQIRELVKRGALWN